MDFSFSNEEIRAYCRNSIESLELWARRLIDEQMKECFGDDYFYARKPDGTLIIKEDLRERIRKMKDSEPNRFPRLVDALFLEDAIYILCHPELYKKLFKPALDYSYPQGRDAARYFLNKIVPTRNALSHANHISMRQAEQAICYSNDFIDGVKQYFKEVGKEKMWNVPTIVKLTDSRGSVFLEKTSNTDYIFRVGETYKITAEIDNSFLREEYSIKWCVGDYITPYKEADNNADCVIVFSNKHIHEHFSITCRVTSKKEEWHKYGSYDDEKTLMFTVLPNKDS